MPNFFVANSMPNFFVANSMPNFFVANSMPNFFVANSMPKSGKPEKYFCPYMRACPTSISMSIFSEYCSTKEQKVAINVEEGFALSAIGDHFKDNWFIYTVILVDVILIAAIIIAVIRVAKRPSA